MGLPHNIVRLVESLRRAWPGGRTIDALAGELDIQPQRVGAILGQLEKLVPDLAVAQAGQSLRLNAAALPLLADLIELGLATKRVGRSVIVFKKTTSTNDVAWQAARKRSSDGVVVLAETQAAGRGRLGRVWFDRVGQSLLLSVLLLDEPRVAGLCHRLTMAAAVALAEAIEAAVGLTTAIRWPNDLYVHRHKLAGILVESRRGLSPFPGSFSKRGTALPPVSKKVSDTVLPRADVVIGIGVNCNQEPADFPAPLRKTATSLAAELGRAVDRTALARAVLTGLDRWLCDDDELHQSYTQWMDPQARRVRLHHHGRTLEGTVRDVDPVEGLIVELPAGGVAHFPPATVRVEWLDD